MPCMNVPRRSGKSKLIKHLEIISSRWRNGGSVFWIRESRIWIVRPGTGSSSSPRPCDCQGIWRAGAIFAPPVSPVPPSSFSPSPWPAGVPDDLASLAFLARKENILLLGPPGVGKAHLAVTLAVCACQNGSSSIRDPAPRRWKLNSLPACS